MRWSYSIQLLLHFFPLFKLHFIFLIRSFSFPLSFCIRYWFYYNLCFLQHLNLAILSAHMPFPSERRVRNNCLELNDGSPILDYLGVKGLSQGPQNMRWIECQVNYYFCRLMTRNTESSWFDYINWDFTVVGKKRREEGKDMTDNCRSGYIQHHIGKPAIFLNFTKT